MRPLLRDGSLIAAVPLDPAAILRPGDIVVARRPDRQEVEMVKRIQAIDAEGNLFLVGDNPSASTDSRHFGPVSRELLLARVRWRYWPLPLKRL